MDIIELMGSKPAGAPDASKPTQGKKVIKKQPEKKMLGHGNDDKAGGGSHAASGKVMDAVPLQGGSHPPWTRPRDLCLGRSLPGKVTKKQPEEKMLDHTVMKERFASRAFQSRFTNQFEQEDAETENDPESVSEDKPKIKPITKKRDYVKNLVAILTKAKENSVGVLGKSSGNEASTWRRIAIAVDSGACDNVISPDDVPEQQVMESSASKKGENFYSATGEPIPNLGDIKLPMIMREGTSRGMLMRAAPVSKPLASVKKICQAGHAVVFDDEGSFIINKTTGEMNWMREDDGNYMLDAWVPPPENANEGFIRQP